MTTPQGDGATHRPDLFGLVTREIGALCIDGLDESRIDEDSLLIDDLGLDSLKFVDLTLRLEEALGVEEFPMQDWVDTQLEGHRPLSVRALVAACHEVCGG
jgi:acyl carrier protein